ncbi:hypothetical protein PENFLA_c014G07594 [Penicillium flavigenum]|uniref:Rhodopsin domain-containing protein n=1 Tax=Penicillium flavigenum TaxID=254877 RepID=A0A1V6T5U1_9EURO|nr:hypothetical protein PENFLA_c014G07594 [Penicillium flavigenum]
MPPKYVLAYLQFMQAAGLHEGRMEETMVPSIIICNTIMLVLASAGVSVKLLMLGHPRNIGADGVTRYGYGKHIEAVEADIPAMSMFLKLVVVAAISYLIAMTAIQVSFCLLYKRLFAVAHAGWPYWFLITIVVLQFIEELVCATSIIRATYLKRFQVDYTWDLVNALNWSAVEVCTAIFIACIPSFKALITAFFPLLRKYMGFPSGSTPHQHIHENSGDSPTDYFNLPATQRVQNTPDCFPLPSPALEYQEPTDFIMSGAVPTVREDRASRQDLRLDYNTGGSA